MALSARSLTLVRSLTTAKSSFKAKSRLIGRCSSNRAQKFSYTRRSTFPVFSIPNSTHASISVRSYCSNNQTNPNDIKLLIDFYSRVKQANLFQKLDPKFQQLMDDSSPEQIVSKMDSANRALVLEKLRKSTSNDVEEIAEETLKQILPESMMIELLKRDEMDRNEMLKFLAEPLPAAYATDDDSKEAEIYRRTLDVRVSHIMALVNSAEGNLEVTGELVNEGLTLRVLEMFPHSTKNNSVTCLLLHALRILATQELAVDQMLHSPTRFIPYLVSLLRSQDLSVRIEASTLIALLTIIRDAVFALKENNIVPSLTSILSSPFIETEQALYNNGIVALVRIIAVSGDAIAEDLKKEQAITPLCNIINKLDRTPAVHDAVVTLLTILAGAPEISLQIVASGCVPSLARILKAYVEFVSGKVSARDFRRVTSASKHARPAVTEEDEAIVDDDDASEDYLNPIYRGSDPEDIIPLMRLLSRVPRARQEMLGENVPVELTSLVAMRTLPYSQKTQATNCLANFASDPAAQKALVETDVAKLLTQQTIDAATSPEEAMFQSHALAVLALLSAHERVQKYTSEKYWLNSVIPRATKTQEKPVQQAIGSILLNLLRGALQDDVREIIENSDIIKGTIAHMVRLDQTNQTKFSVWSSVYSLT